jgi:hypothetical protein
MEYMQTLLIYNVVLLSEKREKAKVLHFSKSDTTQDFEILCQFNCSGPNVTHIIKFHVCACAEFLNLSLNRFLLFPILAKVYDSLYYFVVVRAAVKSVPLHYTDEWLDYD